MKNLFAVALIAFALIGCRTRYDITLFNGNKITGVGKPVLDNSTGQYRFKTADGREGAVSAARVRVIEPHGDSSASKFASPTK
jgi:hypothetical protein